MLLSKTKADSTMRSLYYTQSNSTGSVRVVFLHGLGGDSGGWDELRELLEQKIQVETIAIDLAGQGNSSRDYLFEQLTVENQAVLVTDLLTQLPKKPTVLIGHCYGSLVAMVVGAKAQSVIGLILISVGSQLPILGSLVHTRFGSIVNRSLRALYSFLPKAHASFPRNLQPFIDSGQFSVYRVLSDIAHTSIATYIALLWHAGFFVADHYVQSLQVPVQVFQGNQDRIFSVRSVRALISSCKNCQLQVIAGAHHVVVLQTIRWQLYEFIATVCQQWVQKKSKLSEIS